MKKNWKKAMLAGAAVMFVLAGCGNSGKTKETIPTPSVTETPVSTETPTEVPTEVPTETPVPLGDSENNVEPIVTLSEYKGMTLYEVDSSVVAEEIRKLLESCGEYILVNRAAAEGDAVNINYVGKKDGVAFEGGTDDSEAGYDLVLGSGTFIDGFEAGLIGAVAGEVRELNLKFPENYGSEELAGQEVVFTVTVNSVKEWIVPELTDEYALEQFGYTTSAELIMTVYDNLNRESYYEQITNEVMESCQVENLPADRIEAEKQSMIDYYTSYAQYYGSYYGMDTEVALKYFFGIESLDTLAAFAEEYAAEQIRYELVMTEIFNKELTEEAYEERLLQYLEFYNIDEETFFAEYGGEDYVRQQIKTELVLNYIISQAVIIEAESDIDMNQMQVQ